MNGRDEQLRCRSCDSTELVFGTYNDRTYPFDIHCKNGNITVVPLKYSEERVLSKTLIMEVANDFYVMMSDDMNAFVWSCPECNKCYNSYTTLYEELCEVLRRFIE